MRTLLDARTGKLALVFPGQGSQAVGMGRDLYEGHAGARAIFDQAEKILGWPLTRLCFEGPEEELRDTAASQPAIVTHSIALLAVLRDRLAERGFQLAPCFAAGHSVGQYAALVACDVIDFESAIRLVGERGRLMKEAGAQNPGGMAAVIGLDDETVDAVCREAAEGGIVVAANYNMPGQVVISGENGALERAATMAIRRGARKVIPLSVTVANHSPVMGDAAEKFNVLLNDLSLGAARVPLVANGNGRPIVNVKEIRVEMARHMTAPVRWTSSVQTMADAGVDTFWEVGSGQVLTGLIKRTVKHAKVAALGNSSDVETITRAAANLLS